MYMKRYARQYRGSDFRIVERQSSTTKQIVLYCKGCLPIVMETIRTGTKQVVLYL